MTVQEEIALGFAAGAQAGRPQPVHERRARGCPIAGVYGLRQRRPRDRPRVVVEGHQRVELVGCERHGHGAHDLRFVPGKVVPEQPQRLPDAGVEIGRHAARQPAGIGRARRRGVADAEGPDLFHIEIGSRHDALVPGEGQKPPVGHDHVEVT